MSKNINIKTPIWYNRSVGLNVEGMDRMEDVDVTISYKNKQGELVFPGTFRIPVYVVRSFPISVVKGTMIILHIVPIQVLQQYLIKD